MTEIGSGSEGGQGPEEWAKAYVAFLAFAGLIILILLAKGLYLALGLVVAAVLGVALLVRRFGSYLRQ